MKLSDKLLSELNAQMNREFGSAHIYMAMASYCASENLDGFANFFVVQAEEERFHAMKIYNYINMQGLRATFDSIPAPSNEFTSILDTFERGLGFEQGVTKQFYGLMDIATTEHEYATINFLKWFVDEQVEEEATFDAIIQKLKRIDKDSNAFYMLDAEMAQRTFVPPVA